MKMKRAKTWTVVAQDENEGQILCYHIQAPDAQEAAIRFAEQLALSDFVVLAVFPGNHKSQYPEEVSSLGEHVVDLLKLRGGDEDE